MKETLVFILQHLVDHPDDISVDETQEEQRTILVVHANPEDIGKIIGKSGRIINALRDLVKLMATKQGDYVDVTVAE